ncbi:antitermination protein [Salmonella enterica subsp. enterica serovar Choleraesuis]|nr:antitermination protein [Salmonella enterica subsp. enterica serovar Choleraesuis]
MRDIQMVLERWGAWAANEGNGVDYSAIAAGFKGLLPSTSKSRVSCSDGDGLIIDSALIRLKKKDAHLFMLLNWYYVYGTPVRAMGEKLGVSHTQVLKRLQAAEGFIDGCLSMLGTPLEMDRYCTKENIYGDMPKKVAEFQNAL